MLQNIPAVFRPEKIFRWMIFVITSPVWLKTRQIWSRLQSYLILMEMLKCYDRNIFNIKSVAILVSSCLSTTPIILKNFEIIKPLCGWFLLKLFVSIVINIMTLKLNHTVK
ncbi:Uncharacterised protein [Escherichia coli]|nr:Uncharacterised protein [Escherichia coli]CAD5668709.1 Uncharacterised protein [Escherichia coli]CTY39340.1 Uncharacterised protein [Escherichia coli]